MDKPNHLPEMVGIKYPVDGSGSEFIILELVPTSSVEHFHEFSPCSTAVGTGRPRHTAAPFLGEALARQHIQQPELKSLKLYTPQGGTLCYRTEIRRRNPVL